MAVKKEIFSRVKELKEHGLDVPQATELAFELKEAGMPLTEGILSRQELVEQLTALLSEPGRPERSAPRRHPS